MLDSLILVLKHGNHDQKSHGRRHLFLLQNTYVETQPKRMDNRVYGKALEHAGDIFREMTMRGELKPYSKSYTDEKVRRLRSMLNDEEFLYPLSAEDAERVSSMEYGWFKITPDAGMANDAKELATLVLRRDRKGALKKLSEVDAMLSKFYDE